MPDSNWSHDYLLRSVTKGTAKFPPEKFASSPSGGAGSSGATTGPQEIPTEPKKVVLNSAEELYAELRDRNFNAVGPLLSKRAKIISAQFDVI